MCVTLFRLIAESALFAVILCSYSYGPVVRGAGGDAVDYAVDYSGPTRSCGVSAIFNLGVAYTSIFSDRGGASGAARRFGCRVSVGLLVQRYVWQPDHTVEVG